MTDLSREAKALVEAGRDGWRPSADDRARILGKLGGASSMLATKDALAPKSLAPEAGRMLTHWGLVGLPIVASAIVIAGLQLGSERPSPASNHGVEVAAAPVHTEKPSSDQTAPPSVGSAESVVAGQLPPAPPPGTARKKDRGADDAARDRLSEEVALLSKAQTELYAGRARQALETLDEHERRFRKGALAEERTAARIRALCALGRTSEADARLAALARSSPRSPYLERAREACGRARK